MRTTIGCHDTSMQCLEFNEMLCHPAVVTESTDSAKHHQSSPAIQMDADHKREEREEKNIYQRIRKSVGDSNGSQQAAASMETKCSLF